MRWTRALDRKVVYRFESGLEIRLHNLLAGIGLMLVALILAALAVETGATSTGMTDLLQNIFGSGLSDDQAYALWTVRLPRLLMAFLAGWCVAISGAILQSIARNPLADPGLFGLSQGSMTTILLLMVLAPAAPKILVAGAAMAGGLCVALLLIWLVGGERSSGLAIMLMGIAMETVLSSTNTLMLLYTPSEVSMGLSQWLAGSLFQSSWSLIATFLPAFGLSFAGIFLWGRALSTYDLGNEMAMALGEPLGRSRPLILIFAVFLNAAAVTAVGPLTFLGVLAPHIAGFLSPASGRARLLLSGLVGGILVIGADTVARRLAGDLPLPIGLSLTIIGVPLFILALRLQALSRKHKH
ncbi:iron ABC transporter permease [Rhizobium sp. L1K21]|uniref:FecCD family ABC transporter permease n=1 Tax=Rhizobium sp. L1K21 TaxID=2954933 RepID=UPI002093EAC2|nr:iron ABC transporter permease [Rhizobium sp. L1K21]MCO6187560.1 iron ABC transporter permease [Rhizobium sp. L1K21]